MNFFVLDTNPAQAAVQNCDKHVCKIILEAADCLCIAHWETHGRLPRNAPEILTTPRQVTNKRGATRIVYRYRPQTQRNNHVTRWVRAAEDNYDWTVCHGLALSTEYTRRYGKIHASDQILRYLEANRPTLPSGSTPFRQAVADDPVDCKRDDVVLAYKLYYAFYKHRFAKWRNNNTPAWYLRMREVIDNFGSVSDVEAVA